MLAGAELDVLVVGGGIVGACTARDAALRGLRVGIIDRADFGGGASANCLKIVHGGLRYLQHLDMRRMRESIVERSYWLRAAPHLVEPLPIVMPTYRRRFPPRALLAGALAVNELVSGDRNRGMLPERRLPRSRVLSRRECVDLVPELHGPGLTGGILFHDGIMYSPERLALEIVDAARMAGAVTASYVEFESARIDGGRIVGAHLRDVLRDEPIHVRTRWIVNATGEHAAHVAARITGHAPVVVQSYSIALNLVTRQPARAAAFTISGGTSDPDRVGPASARQLFVVPWRGQTMIGTAHLPLEGDPESFTLEERHVTQFFDEVAGASPSLQFSMDDVVLVHRGLLPVLPPGSGGGIRLLKRHTIHDHAGEGARGALSLVSVKYTTARRVAEDVVDIIAAGERITERSSTASQPLPGGGFGSLERLRTEARQRYGSMLPDDVLEHLVRVYGRRYEQVIAHRSSVPEWDSRVVAGAPVIHAQLVHGAQSEHARTAEDLLLRRTEIGARGLLDDGAVRRAADVMREHAGT